MKSNPNSGLHTPTCWKVIRILMWVIFAAVIFLAAMDWTKQEWKAVLLPILYLVGTIAAQAKDIASRHGHSQGVLRDVGCAFKEAWDSQYSAAFLFRSIEWGTLAIAAALLTKIIA